MKSIQRSLTLSILTVFTLLWLASSWYLEATLRNKITALFDKSLLDKSRVLSTLAAYAPTHEFGFNFADEIMPEFDTGSNPEYFQLWLNNDKLYERSRSLGTSNLPRLEAKRLTHEYQDIVLPDGRAGRMVQLSFIPRNDELSANLAEQEDPDNEPPDSDLSFLPAAAKLSFAKERESIDQLILFVRSTIITTMVTVAIIMALLIRSLVSRGLRPIKELARQVKEVTETRLDYRVGNTGHTAAELFPIELEINNLLSRFESSYLQIKQFSSDASHELLTPIAELRTLAEIGVKNPDDKETITEFFEDVHHISKQMQRLATEMVDLSKLESGEIQARISVFSLSDLLDDIWQGIAYSSEKKLNYINIIPAELEVSTDIDKLRIVLRNLLDNAAAYSTNTSDIHVEFTRGTETGSIVIYNDTPEIKPDDLRHLKDRFWQKDGARSDNSHAGLGLSIADSIVSILDLELNFRIIDDTVFSASVRGLRYA